MKAQTAGERTTAIDWTSVAAELDAQGWAPLPSILRGEECEDIARLYDSPRADLFRSHITMARQGFGKGEYRYFAYPLPDMIQSLRTTIYPRVAPIANRWNERLGIEARFPLSHVEFVARCHAAGQTRSTPLLLRYGAGDYNCLHQDLYGELVFPLQVAILLSEPGRDFLGGEIILTEQRPRMQTRASVVPLTKGDAIVFAVNHRPVRGLRGDHRVTHRHGVSKIREGHRHALGIIFHDAA